MDDLGLLLSNSFSLLANFILSELLRRGGTGGGVQSLKSTDDSDEEVVIVDKLRVGILEPKTGGGDRYGGGCFEPDWNELSESTDDDKDGE